MTRADILGYIAALLVFATFYMKDMAYLRALALCSNLAFLAYGLAIGALPIILLHAALMPINARRLGEELQARGFSPGRARQFLRRPGTGAEGCGRLDTHPTR